MRRRVVASFNNDAGDRCVDIFVLEDGKFGFEEYRRDPEDLKGWFAPGHHAAQGFASPQDALAHAKARVPWLDES